MLQVGFKVGYIHWVDINRYFKIATIAVIHDDGNLTLDDGKQIDQSKVLPPF